MMIHVRDNRFFSKLLLVVANLCNLRFFAVFMRALLDHILALKKTPCTPRVDLVLLVWQTFPFLMVIIRQRLALPPSLPPIEQAKTISIRLAQDVHFI